MQAHEVPYEQSPLYRIRHSAAHIMAQAVLEQFPAGKIAIGPPIEDGFYYDFDLPRALTPDDLEAIERRMREIIRGDHPFVRRELGVDEARRLFKDQAYKLELIDGLEQGELDEHGAELSERPAISTYKHDTFEDLCRGPHVERTSEIEPGAVKLLRVSGAYWRGDEHRPQLQRIYGTAWESPEQLQAYLQRLEEVKARDHRVLGRDLDLFTFSPDVGPGLVLWTPRGGRLREIIEDYWSQRHREAGYGRVYTPHIGKSKLWETSGHLRWYKEGMYAPMTIEEQEYYLKPMSCPFHVQIFKSQTRSYRDLPLRMAEFGTCYRFERSGTLHGLLRPRGFTQDDAHLFCTPEQMSEEISAVLDFCLSVFRDFGMEDIEIELSVHDPNNVEQYAGDPGDWALAERTLAEVVEAAGLSYRAVPGEAVFYGPKIDIALRDALGRRWQLSTIQFDFWLPRVFELEYRARDGEMRRPFMVHRALLGSMERFVATLIEHYKGALPAWLAPVQAVVVPIADRHIDYALDIAAQLAQAELRVEVDDSNDRMSNKIRKAQQHVKPPYILVVGDREMSDNAVSLRMRGGENRGAMAVGDFVAYAQEVVRAKGIQ